MTKDEALKIALEALEVANSCVDGYYIPKGKTQLPEVEEAITAIKEALAQPEQEPVAWVCMKGEKHDIDFDQPEIDAIPVGTFLYTTPPQRKPLTDEEIINKCLDSGFERNSLGWSFTYGKLDYHLLKLARAIEAAHGIKENT